MDKDNFSIPKLTGKDPFVENPERVKTNSLGNKNKNLFIILVLIIILMITLLGFPFIGVYRSINKILIGSEALKNTFKSQNITDIDKELDKFKNNLEGLKKSLFFISWLKFTPFIGGFISDGINLVNAGIHGIDAAKLTLKVSEPYADILGFSGDSSKKPKSGEENAKSRIDFVVETVGSITPQLDKITEKVSLVKADLDKIDPEKYPVTFRGKKIREKIKLYLDLADEISTLLIDGKPIIEVSPFLLGVDAERTYLLLFQNDKELRPTGGFITAYSIIKVKKGKFEPVSSNDIYNLDNKYKPTVEAPAPLVKYLKGPYSSNSKFRLRDMNWDPDFKRSMQLFTEEASKVGVKNIDGVIAVDTNVVVSLLNVIGKIGVPGFGNFSTDIDPRCKCPQVIYELESFADIEGPILWDPSGSGKIIYKPPHADNRKLIVGPLMNSILANALGQPKNKLPDLFKAGFDSLREKHLLFYMFNPKVQKAVESFNIGGTIKEFAGDYLLIDDANLGGRKSNLYVTQEVSQEIKPVKDGYLEKTLTISYKNNEKQDGWLNSVLPTWTRVYVPKGSKLTSVEGFEDQGEVYEESGKTVFSGGFRLRPLGVVKITLKYKVPIKGIYKLLIQKQAGTSSALYTITKGKETKEFALSTDKEVRFGL